MNNYRKIIFSLCLIIIFFARGFGSISAQIETPNFPACSNPQGTLKVTYENGTHGIVGSNAEYRGSDEIYIVNDISLIQCFCADDGQGIQTNWWKISSLTQDEIDTLKKLGWLFVPSGSAWGLDSSPYLAKNSDYICGPTPTVTTSTAASESDNSSGGQESGTSTTTETGTGSVLGLATTGNSLLIYSLLILGLASILLGKILGKDIKY